MGVSGCGKSTLAKALAERLGWMFIEGDECHPPVNIQKMSAGQSLTDADRGPFLRNVALAIKNSETSGVVASCSALKLKYRDTIRSMCHGVKFVLPVLAREELFLRLQARSDHFMPASLVDSQLAALEMPESPEDAIVIDGALPTGFQIEQIVELLDLGRDCQSDRG